MSYTCNAFSFSSANEVNVLQDRKTIRNLFFSYLMKICKHRKNEERAFETNDLTSFMA